MRLILAIYVSSIYVIVLGGFMCYIYPNASGLLDSTGEINWYLSTFFVVCSLAVEQPYNKMNLGYFPWRPLPWNRNKYPCFYIFPLEFGGVGDLHKHQNRGVLCENRNNSSIKTPVRLTLRIHGKHVTKFQPYKSVWCISHAEHFITNKKRCDCMKETRMPPA